MATLDNAEALIVALLSGDGKMIHKVKLRPPLCMHGGFTRTVL